MSFNPEELLKELLKNKRIKSAIANASLNDEQISEALPILIDMSEQVDDEHTKFLTSIDVDEHGNVIRVEVPSTFQRSLEYRDNLLTKKIEQIDFEDNKEFIKEESRRRIVSLINEYIEDKQGTKRGLYIYGDMGVGKTFILKRIAKKLAENDFTIGFITISSFVGYVKTKFGDSVSYLEIIDTIKNVDYLFIDDIGSEQVSSWFRDEILLSILNYRMEKSKGTFFSSNYSQEALEKIEAKTSGSKYRDFDKAARLINRIKALSTEIKLEGKNKR